MREEVDLKFRAAWDVFSVTCSRFLVPEPTYQAWFAHDLISQFGIDRVAREPIVKKQHFAESLKAKVAGDHVRLDDVVTREPGVHLLTTQTAGTDQKPAPDSNACASWR